MTLLILGASFAPQAYAETTTSSTMLEQIKALMAKIEELQEKLATIRGEVKDVIKDGLAEGMTDDDIKEIQELLASDPTIYPEGKITGYFGPLTKEAIKRFQQRHELTVTGTLDEETRELMEEYFKERYGDKVPAGLLSAPGIMKKVQNRFALLCDDTKAMGPFCKKIKDRDRDRDGQDDDSDDDEDSDDEELEVEVEIVNGYTKIVFKIDDVNYKVILRETDEDEVLEAVANKLNVEVADLDADLVTMLKEELADAIADADLDGDFDLEIEIEDGDTTVEFLFEGTHYEVDINDSTDTDDVLDAVADAIDDGDDASDLDSDLRDAIEDMLDDVVAKFEAEEAIDAAEEAIDDARDAIDDASGDTELSDDKADEAEDKLVEAISEFEDEHYDEAQTLADVAKELAEDALDLLPE